MSFRLAGIKILDGCASHIRKILKEGKTYLFSARYAEDVMDEKLIRINPTAGGNLFSRMMYNIHTDNRTLEVSVNAIVGQNGEGKSTLIEVMLRVLNNFAFKQGFLNDQWTLKYVGGLRAILYYEIDCDIYAIECKDNEIGWYRNGNPVVTLAGTDDEKKQYLKENLMSVLFYTMVINYSLYAYTPASLGSNNDGEGYWIDSLFHKNDSYQTPVVLNPMRDKGNIDIIREEYLSKQRLLSIFAKSRENDRVRRVSGTETAVGYAFSVEKESKFLKKTLSGYLLDHLQDELVWGDIQPYDHPQEKLPKDFIERFLEFWMDFKPELTTNQELVNLCKSCLSNQRRLRRTDLRRYLTLINNSAYPVNPKTKRRPRNDMGREFGMLVNTSGDLSKLNYRQFYRLMLILLVWRVLTATANCGMKDARLNEILKAPSEPRNAAMLYLVYKFISIVETYNDFCNGYYLTEENYLVMMRGWPNRDAIGTIEQDLKLILATKDYRTLKFKQTVNYLKSGAEYYDAEPCTFENTEYNYFLSFDNLNKQLAKVNLRDIQWYLPCPVFEGDIILHNGMEYYPLGTLSSGMIQRLNTVGSLIYHLRNLDDEQKGKRMLSYNNICVVLEEVELYYHPEYQKSYLNYLLEQIERAGLQRIESLNLIFVTHSPFILSDIVRDDILCLDRDCQEDLPVKTFGANIHDLLRHPFFMRNGTIGDFAQKIINRIIVSLAVYEELNKKEHQPINMKRFCKEHDDLAGFTDFLPLKLDGTLEEDDFGLIYSNQRLKEAISLIDEPIVRDALDREHKRIFADYVAFESTN